MIMSNVSDTQFKAVVDELIAQGEDREEMEYWADIFSDLPPEKQKEILELFEKELEELKAEGEDI